MISLFLSDGWLGGVYSERRDWKLDRRVIPAFWICELLRGFDFQRRLSAPLGGRKQIDQRQEMDCTGLKQTEKFPCNYNCVQLALTWLLEGPRYFVVQARWAQAWQLFLHVDYTYNRGIRGETLGQNFQASSNSVARKPGLQRCEYSNLTLVFPLSWHWSLASEHEEHMYRSSARARAWGEARQKAAGYWGCCGAWY